MTLDDFVRVGAAALASIESLLGSWFPLGVKEGAEFCIGSRHGEAGKSLRIRLYGDKAGVWSDFSADGEAGGDLIALYAFIHEVSPGKACAALARELGIQLTDANPAASNAKRGLALVKQKAPTNPAPAPAGKGVEALANKKTRTPWAPVMPVPDGAGPYPKAHVVRGKPSAHWEYRNTDGQLLGVIYRFVTSDGGKEVLPCVYAEHPDTGAREWRWIAMPEPRPLYLRGPYRLDLPLLVVEGEKCVDAAFDLIGDQLDVVSWSGGSKATAKSDWSAIRGRDVILWADADGKAYKEKHERAGQIMPEVEQPGMAAMNKIADILRTQDNRVFFVDIPAPGAIADGWDVADLIAGGATADEVIEWAFRLRPEPQSASSPAAVAEEAPAVIPEWFDEPVPDTTESISTPRKASAGGATKRPIRDMLIPTANGGIKGCRENVLTVMQNDPRLIGLVGLDQFSCLQVKRKATPWPSEPGEWSETDDFMLGVYMAENHGLLLASIGDIERGVAQAARGHAFNPVTDYLDRCHSMWDGVPRVESAFSTYWGTVDSEYTRLVATMFFIGLAVRAYRPGVKHDHAPVFEGGQGEGKSTALKVLGGDWFADTPFRMGEKDGYLSIQGVLLYEVAELEQFNRSEVTAIKAFMSSTVDRFREPYGRRMKNLPRRCAFAASTNEGEYFKDNTGNRRFWPIGTGRINIDALIADRDQLFGEAVALMRAGVLWYPTRDQQSRLINDQQESREIPDVWHGRVYEYLEGLDADGKPTMAARMDRVTVRELLTRALHIELSKLGPAKNESMRISAIMRKLGWKKDRETHGARERFYERPVAVSSTTREEASDLPF